MKILDEIYIWGIYTLLSEKTMQLCELNCKLMLILLF